MSAGLYATLCQWLEESLHQAMCPVCCIDHGLNGYIDHWKFTPKFIRDQPLSK
jgi:hypothetical protein